LRDAVPAFVWVENVGAPGAHLELDSVTAHHVARVCRARPGDPLTLTDGQGGLARGRVEKLTPRVTATIEAVERVERTSSGVLLCGAPEGQRFDWAVEKLAELGIARVRPIDCSRASWSRAAVREERWRRVALAALQQSRGRFLLEVMPPAPLVEALDAEGKVDLAVLADPDGSPTSAVVGAGAGTVLGVVGPAEGLDDRERASLLERGLRPIALAAGRLRTETAAVAWGAWWAGAQAQI